MSSNYRSHFNELLTSLKSNRFLKSIWGFPSVVIATFVILVALGISGSSIGIYNDILYGANHEDKDLILGHPRSIRSDEWIVASQMLIAQEETDFSSVNKNIGKGQNMNLITDSPTRDWAQIFRPQNLAFFILPYENAFAYRWWFMAAVLLVVTYFFVLHFFPNRKLLASLLSLSLFYSGFIQWWYISSTIACFALVLAVALVYMKFLDSRSLTKKIIMSLGAVYLLVSFALLLYPPFQIPVALVLAFFLIGYTISNFSKDPKYFLRSCLPYITGIIVLTSVIVGIFIYQNKETINTIQNTSYPGKRIVQSGGYSFSHLLTGHLAFPHQNNIKAASYQNTRANATNQSESSTFMLLSLYLTPLLVYLLYKERNIKSSNKMVSFALVLPLIATGLLFLAWLYIPGLQLLGAVTKLDIVPLNRLIIGIGLLNFILLVIILKKYQESELTLSKKITYIYTFLSLITLLAISFYIKYKMPGFIGSKLAILLSLPLATVIYFYLRKKYILGSLILLLFSVASTAYVNPLYSGASILRENSLSVRIESYPRDGYWISEDIQLENFPQMSGQQSLSGVFAYPQNDIWRPIDNSKTEFRYNRYAHVSYNIDRDPLATASTGFVDTGPDQLVIRTEACSRFIKNSSIKYIISSKEIDQEDQKCIMKIEPVKMSSKVFYIHTLKY